MDGTADGVDGSVALVTGASSGIGEATATALADEGASVVLAARSAEALRALADRIEAAGGDALAVPTDVTDEGSVAALFEAIRSEYDELNVLVNSAGVIDVAPVGDADPAALEAMVEVNLLGLMCVTRRALSVLEPGASVVNVSSVSGRRAAAGYAGYSATKFGVNGFSEALRREAGEELRVTVVEPGLVDTDLSDHAGHESVAGPDDRTDAITPLESDDVAAAVVYAVTQPSRVAVNEILLRPSGQER
jgi:NADP-dependent 3-hydroxy acid dehydrogenase YdfG